MGKAIQPISVDGIEFDALINESRTLEADSPEYPIESGFVIGDSIILRPQRIDMTLYVTNSPITWKNRLGSDPNRIQSVIQSLEELYYSKKLISIITSDKTFENMAIMSMTISKSRETGYAREIPISFKEIRVTEATTVTIPDEYGRSGTTETTAGTANTTNSTPISSSVTGNSASQSSSSQSSSGRSSILYNAASSIGIF